MVPAALTRAALLLAALTLTLPTVTAQSAEAPASSSRTMLDAVREDLLALRFEKALAALDALLGEPEMTEAERAEAWVLKAQSHVALGDLDAAERDYAQILELRPGYAPEASLTTPQAQARFEKVRKRMVGTIVLEVDPADARVRVDGRAVVPEAGGVLPVLAGARKIELSRDGFDPLSREVIVAADEMHPIQLRMVPNARTVVLTTDVPGVEVKLDGIVVGVTAVPDDPGALPVPQLVLPGLALGEHRYEFSKPCFRTHAVREILNVDLIERSEHRPQTVRMVRTSSRLVVSGRPEGAEVRIDGERVGTVPLDGAETCPDTRTVEIVFNGRTLWRSTEQFLDADEVALEVTPRPNVALYGADSWPSSLRFIPARFNATTDRELPSGDLTTVAGWRSVALDRNVDIAIAVLPGERPGAPERRVIYSPVLATVHSLDEGTSDADPPDWSVPLYGFEVVDSRYGGPLRVATVAPDGPAAQVGLAVGDRIASIDGETVADAPELARRLAEAGETIRLGRKRGEETTEATLTAQISPRVVDGVGDPVEAAFRAAWALVSTIVPDERTPAAMSNLALMFSEFGSPDAAVETWKRVRFGRRDGIGEGTVQYYLGREHERAGRESEAIAAYRKAAVSEATVFNDRGPAVAPAARDRLTDLGVSAEEEP